MLAWERALLEGRRFPGGAAYEQRERPANAAKPGPSAFAEYIAPLLAIATKTDNLDDMEGFYQAAASPSLRPTDDIEPPQLAKTLSFMVPGGGDVVGAMDDAPHVARAWQGAVSEPSVGSVGSALGQTALAGLSAFTAVPALLGSIAGKGAKTADLVKLRQAEEMAAKGASREAIYDATKWWAGPDGKWRFEIDDSGMRVKGGSGKLGDVVEHDKLFAAYPDLADIDVEVGGLPRNSYGEYYGGEAGESIKYRPKGGDAGKKPLLHESGHAIESREGFAKGGNMFGLTKENGGVQVYRQILEDMTTPRPIEDFAREAGFESVDAAQDAYAQYVKGIEKMRRSGVPPALDRAAQETAMRQAYERQTGEAYARLAETRADYSKAQRDARYPWLDLDVPEDQQIVRFRSNGPQMSAASGRRLLHDAPYSKYKIDPDLPQRLDQGLTVRATPDYEPPRVISPEDLMRYDYLLNLVGDRTNVGEITRLYGELLNMPIRLDGGQGYMRGLGTGAWASDPNVTKRLANAVRSADGRSVLGTYMAMSGTGSDFANMTRDVALRNFNPGELRKRDIREFNKRFKAAKGFEKLTQDFPGIESPELSAWLDKSGTRRAAFFDFLDRRGWVERGFPDVTAARYAIQDPQLRDLPAGVEQYGGTSMALMDPAGTVRHVSDTGMPHATYPTDMPGQYIGGLQQPVPRRLLFPEWYEERRLSGAAPAGDNRAFQMSQVLQPINQKWLDDLMKWVEANQPR